MLSQRPKSGHQEEKKQARPPASALPQASLLPVTCSHGPFWWAEFPRSAQHLGPHAGWPRCVCTLISYGLLSVQKPLYSLETESHAPLFRLLHPFPLLGLEP